MDQYDYFSDGSWPQHREFEVHLTTYDGAQHLRLNGWLKRKDILVKSEGIHNKKGAETFGSFIVYINDIMLEKLKEENLDRGLFCDIEVFNSGKDRYYTYKKNKEENVFEKIKDFMFNFQINDKEDIAKFLTQANETSLALFKKNKDFVTDYVKTKDLSQKEKIRDIDLMIESFEEQERYEDCAFLIKLKNKVKKHYIKQKLYNNE
tara:strand:- start:505 stop:1122 length:618 start_codon:yes stop_codon:yes gene_type:complete